MKKDDLGQKDLVEISLNFKGQLMSEGSLEYRTLLETIEGTAGSIESLTRLTNLKSPISFNLKPPEEGSFHIVLQVIEWIGATSPLWAQVSNVKDLVSILIEYFKILQGLKGEELNKENVQTNHGGEVIVKDNTGSVVYTDNKKVTNINLIINVAGDITLNKRIDKIATALEKSSLVDELTLGLAEGESMKLLKSEASYYKYNEKTEERADTIVGYIRKIDNRTNNGSVLVLEEDKEISVNFSLDIKDIQKLEKIVKTLALAEANESRVVLVGERVMDVKGKLKKLIVNDIEILDKKIDFGS